MNEGGGLMRAKITKRTVDTAEPGGATNLVRDTEVKGFVLVVTPASASISAGVREIRVRDHTGAFRVI
jgi:hypothetical protein